MAELKYIPVNLIDPHPDNPRKDLGDLTELAASIKANGILQNLTVVPHEDRYCAVIGHRRHAASKMAGLAEVPCVVSDMSPDDQIRTMLMENMQRSDLTPREQAQGFQMMLDLGDSVDDIAVKTGFSGATVRRRVKLLELDSEKFQKSEERGATLQDYAELEKIEDITRRNSVLDKVGTANFRNELQRAISDETHEKNAAAVIAQLEKFATRTDNSSGMQQVAWYDFGKANLVIDTPEDADTTEYFFTASGNYYAYLYKKCKQTQQVDKLALEREKQKKRLAALKTVSDRAYNLRYSFVENFAGFKKYIPVLMEYTVRLLMMGQNAFNLDTFRGLIAPGEAKEADESSITDSAVKLLNSPQQSRALLAALYCASEDKDSHYYDWQGTYDDDCAELNYLYDLLEAVGYEISDEEKAMRDGTHELFRREDDTK